MKIKKGHQKTGKHGSTIREAHSVLFAAAAGAVPLAFAGQRFVTTASPTAVTATSASASPGHDPLVSLPLVPCRLFFLILRRPLKHCYDGHQ